MKYFLEIHFFSNAEIHSFLSLIEWLQVNRMFVTTTIHKIFETNSSFHVK